MAIHLLSFAKRRPGMLCTHCSLPAYHNIYSHFFIVLLLLGFLFFPRNRVIAELKPKRSKSELFITPFLTCGDHYARSCESVRRQKLSSQHRSPFSTASPSVRG